MMVKKVLIAGFLGLACLGVARAQDLPNLPDVTNQPGVPPTIRTGEGEVPGLVFSSPTAGASSDLSTVVNASVNATAESALRGAPGGTAPSSTSASSWRTSGFNSRIGPQIPTGNRQHAAGQNGDENYAAGAGAPASEGMIDPFPDPMMTSDIPDLAMAPGLAIGLSEDGGNLNPPLVSAGAPMVMQSSIQSPAVNLDQYDLPQRAVVTASRRTMVHRFTSLHSRLAGRPGRSTLSARTASRLHTTLRER